MTARRALAAPLALLALAAGCADGPAPTAAPTPAPALDRGGTVREQGRYPVAMLDDCDAVSWIGFGECAIAGAVTRAQFQAAVAAMGFHPAWRNAPEALDVKQNAKLRVTNAGGREHTFTRVARFGGGFVAPLNRLPDTRIVAPECALAAAQPDAIVEPGAAIEVRVDHGGHVGDHDERYQCCIHPWMRTTVRVRHDAPR